MMDATQSQTPPSQTTPDHVKGASNDEGGPPSEPVGHPASGHSPSPPQAAKTVLEGTHSEREAALAKTLKDRETRLAELEDENRLLKTPKAPPTPKPKKDCLESFFDGD